MWFTHLRILGFITFIASFLGMLAFAGPGSIEMAFALGFVSMTMVFASIGFIRIFQIALGKDPFERVAAEI